MGTFSPPEFRLRSQSKGSEGGDQQPSSRIPGAGSARRGGSGLQPRAAGTGGGRGRTSAVHGSHEVPAVRPAPQLLLQVEAPGADDLLHVREVLVVPPPAQGSLQNTKREESAQNRGGGDTHTVSEPPLHPPRALGRSAPSPSPAQVRAAGALLLLAVPVLLRRTWGREDPGGGSGGVVPEPSAQVGGFP